MGHMDGGAPVIGEFYGDCMDFDDGASDVTTHHPITWLHQFVQDNLAAIL